MAQAIFRYRRTPAELWQQFRDTLPPWGVCALVLLTGLLIPALVLRYPMPYAILAVAGLMGLTFVVTCPYLGMLVFLGLLYLRPEESFPALAGARMTLLVSLAVLFAWAVNALLTRRPFLGQLPIVRCFVGFFVVAVGSTALADASTLTEVALELVKLLILFILFVHLVDSERRVHSATGALVLFTAILGARTIWQYQHGDAYFEEGEARALATGIFGDPNDLALVMAMALPLALGALMGARCWWTRLWNLAAVPVLVWTIFVTNSRGGMLALAAGVLLFFGRRMGRAGAVAGAMAVLLMFSFGPSRLSQMNSDEESAQGRVTAWEAGLEMLQSSPVWGVGKGQFTEHHWLTAHNSLVLCLAEVGLLGTWFWLGLFYFVFRDIQWLSRRNAAAADGAPSRDNGPPLAALPPAAGVPVPAQAGRKSHTVLLQISLTTFLVGGFFLSRTYSPPLYVYLGLAAAAAQVEAQRAGVSLPAATVKDWGRVATITLGGLVLIMGLVRLWGE
jgi:O-antigen ligase